MRKSLITLLALGGVTMGVGLEDGQLMTDTSLTLPSTWDTNGASVTLLLNVGEFTKLLDSTTDAARPVIVSMTDGKYTAGFALCEEATQSIVGSWGVTAGGTYNNKYSMNSNSGLSNLTSAFSWTNVKAAALTLADNMVYDEATAVYYLTVLLNDNTYQTLSGSNVGLKMSDCGDITKISINGTIVQQAYAFDGVLSMIDAVSLNESMIAAAVPEPTTATLSLLALCGLCARRRRK